MGLSAFNRKKNCVNGVEPNNSGVDVVEPKYSGVNGVEPEKKWR